MKEKIKILIVGAGLTGCTLARILKNKGYNISIIEKDNHIGGLCYTKVSPNGILYEPYGGHAFHTKDKRVKEFVLNFTKFNNYSHQKGIIIDDILYHFPLSRKSILKMNNNDQILKELEDLPKYPDLTNFETYAISKFGITLYKIFIYNYSKKMWDVEPSHLSTDYILNRINLTNSNQKIFEDNFQGLPINGYTEFLKKMIKGIPIKFNSCKFDESLYDLILFSGRIDELLNFKFGALQFRSLRFYYTDNGNWENEKYGSINLPQHKKYIRKINFKIMHKQKTDKSWIQYQEPLPCNNGNLPMYPIYTEQNIEIFNNYLKEICKSNKIIPIGRLGLYKYLEMGQAISLSMNMIPLIENWKNLSAKERYLGINHLLNN